MSMEETPERPRNSSNKHVNDEENKSQNATINRIQRYRDDISDYQRFFAQNELTGEMDEKRQHRSYHQLVKGFLQLLKPYLMDDEIEVSGYYWNDIQLGTFDIDPPKVIQSPSRGEVENALRYRNRQTVERADPRNQVEPKRYRVEGLRDFDAAEVEWDVSWTVMYGPNISTADIRSKVDEPSVRVVERSKRTEPITVVRTVRVPRQVLNNVVTALENFVRELGMDVEFEADPYTGEGGPGI